MLITLTVYLVLPIFLTMSHEITISAVNQVCRATPGLSPELVWIEGGEFSMGSSTGEAYPDIDEAPLHQVSITAFSMSRCEISHADYAHFANDTVADKELPADDGWGRGNRPVNNVSWEDARSYASWMGDQIDQSCDLPTEAEWEYAARAGTTTAYSVPEPEGSDNLEGKNLANCVGCGSEWDKTSTAPVGSFPPNAWGLYDMHGNVWEWVQDCWHGNYENAPADGSAWLEANGGDCGRRVLRGGSWNYYPASLRSAYRLSNLPVDRVNDVGFRVVCRPH